MATTDLYTKILERLLSKGLVDLDDLVERGVVQETDIDKMMEEILEYEKNRVPEAIPFNNEIVHAFGRYQDLEFLAEGGMSKVIKLTIQNYKEMLL